MEAGDVVHPKEEKKNKEDGEEAKPAKEKKEKKEKKDKSKEKEKVEEVTDATKLRSKLKKIDVKIDDLKAKKQEIVARLLELEGTVTNAAPPPASG